MLLFYIVALIVMVVFGYKLDLPILAVIGLIPVLNMYAVLVFLVVGFGFLCHDGVRGVFDKVRGVEDGT